jgi:hypothetical protein
LKGEGGKGEGEREYLTDPHAAASYEKREETIYSHRVEKHAFDLDAAAS